MKTGEMASVSPSLFPLAIFTNPSTSSLLFVHFPSFASVSTLQCPSSYPSFSSSTSSCCENEWMRRCDKVLVAKPSTDTVIRQVINFDTDYRDIIHPRSETARRKTHGSSRRSFYFLAQRHLIKWIKISSQVRICVRMHISRSAFLW